MYISVTYILRLFLTPFFVLCFFQLDLQYCLSTLIVSSEEQVLNIEKITFIFFSVHCYAFAVTFINSIIAKCKVMKIYPYCFFPDCLVLLLIFSLLFSFMLICVCTVP
jgi:hypothetical protein